MKLRVEAPFAVVPLKDFGKEKGKVKNRRTQVHMAAWLGIGQSAVSSALKAAKIPDDYATPGVETFVVLDQPYGRPVARLRVECLPVDELQTRAFHMGQARINRGKDGWE